MKRVKYLLVFVLGLSPIALFLSSCAEDPLPPQVEIHYQMGEDGYTVSFSATVENVNSYAWDFGDGTGTSTEEAPQHIFPKSGNYTVTLTVTGNGGSENDAVTIIIEATTIEYLTGGPGDTDGKTWVLSPSATIGVDGMTAVDPNYTPVHFQFIDNILGLFGLDTEYDNEFTFYYDGSYDVKGINSAALYGRIFGNVAQTTPVIDPGLSTRMYAGVFTDIADAEWTLHEDANLTKNSCNEDYPNGNSDPPQDVTFTGVDYLTFSNGAFFGIRDFNTEVIIREISADKMIVTLFLSSLDEETYPEWFQKPSLLITFTAVPK